MRFELVATEASPLWDFGWFDRSRFRVEGDGAARLTPADVLAELLAAPIFRRAFCTRPDPWGLERARHGPFELPRLVPSLWQPVTPREVRLRFAAALASPDFDEPPSAAARAPVDAWIADLERDGAAAYLLDRELGESAFAPDAHLWLLFSEVIAILPERSELRIGVIGYD